MHLNKYIYIYLYIYIYIYIYICIYIYDLIIVFGTAGLETPFECAMQSAKFSFETMPSYNEKWVFIPLVRNNLAKFRTIADF